MRALVAVVGVGVVVVVVVGALDVRQLSQAQGCRAYGVVERCRAFAVAVDGVDFAVGQLAAQLVHSSEQTPDKQTIGLD